MLGMAKQGTGSWHVRGEAAISRLKKQEHQGLETAEEAEVTEKAVDFY